MLDYNEIFHDIGLIDDKASRESWSNCVINVATLELPDETVEVICRLIHKAIKEELGNA